MDLGKTYDTVDKEGVTVCSKIDYTRRLQINKWSGKILREYQISVRVGNKEIA